MNHSTDTSIARLSSLQVQLAKVQQRCDGRFAAMPAKVTALFEAVAAGQHTRMQQLLQDQDVWYALLLGADTCSVLGTGKSCMQLAAADGSIDVMQQLLAAGADGTHRDACGRTALHEAAANGNISMLKLLLAGGTEPLRDHHSLYFKTASGSKDLSSALPLAAAGGHTEALRVLLEAGADPSQDLGDSEGLTALHHAARLDLPEACKLLLDACAGRLVDTLVSDRASLHGRRSPLQIAAFYGSCNAADVLLAAAADTGSVDILGQTILHTAVSMGHMQLAGQLLAAGAFVDAAGTGRYTGFTPLMQAVSQGNVGAVKMLLQAGADADVQVPIPAAPGSPCARMLHLAAEAGHADVLQLLLDESVAFINSPFCSADPQHDCRGETPLQVAVQLRKYAAADVLLRAGASVDAATPHNPYRPLEAAVRIGDVQLVQLLIKAGADVNARSAFGFNRSFEGLNQLAFAALHTHPGAVPVVQALLSAGARSSSIGVLGHDALEVALDTRQLSMTRTLLVRESFPLDKDQVSVLMEAAVSSLKPDCREGTSSYDVSALLQLQLHKTAKQQGEDPGPIFDEVFEDERLEGCERSAVSLALLKGWASDTAEADTAHAVLSAEEAQQAATRVGAHELLIQQQSAQRA